MVPSHRPTFRPYESRTRLGSHTWNSRVTPLKFTQRKFWFLGTRSALRIQRNPAADVLDYSILPMTQAYSPHFCGLPIPGLIGAAVGAAIIDAGVCTGPLDPESHA